MTDPGRQEQVRKYKGYHRPIKIHVPKDLPPPQPCPKKVPKKATQGRKSLYINASSRSGTPSTSPVSSSRFRLPVAVPRDRVNGSLYSIRICPAGPALRQPSAFGVIKSVEVCTMSGSWPPVAVHPAGVRRRSAWRGPGQLMVCSVSVTIRFTVPCDNCI